MNQSAEARKAAKAQGASSYQGAPCELGHVERYTSNRACVECTRAARREAYDKATATMAKRAYRAKLGAALLDL